MAFRPIQQSSARPNLYICPRCIFATKLNVPRRGIGTKYLAKVKQAEEEWAEKAAEIYNGERKSMLSILEERGYINQIAGKREALDSLLTKKRIGAYVGIDPTGPSLHIGHMIPLMSLFWMFVHGYRSVTLLGGATARVGDPTGRTEDREVLKRTTQVENMVRIHYQLKKIWVNVETMARRHGYEWDWAWSRKVENNNVWLNQLPLTEFLQTIGSGMRMGTMLSRDTVKNKMNSSAGMSLAEFIYPALQAWDWWHLFTRMRVQLQIGGSDQFGNIVAGLDAVNYIRSTTKDPALINKGINDKDPLMGLIGFTTPLLTSSGGEKLGKSAGNAVWLDGEMTSPYDLYGYWLRQSDADVEKYLKFFTFVPVEEIQTVVAEHMEDPKKRKAQHLLAREFVELIHGAEVATLTEEQHRMLNGKNKTSPPDLSKFYTQGQTPGKNEVWPSLNSVGPSPVTKVQLPISFVHEKAISRIIHAAGLASSRSEAHRLVTQGAVYVLAKNNPSDPKPLGDFQINWIQCRLWKVEQNPVFINEGIMTFRKGKNQVLIVEVVDDEQWKKLGKILPGDSEQEPQGAKTTRRKPVVELAEEDIVTFEVGDEEEQPVSWERWGHEKKRAGERRNARDTARSAYEGRSKPRSDDLLVSKTTVFGGSSETFTREERYGQEDRLPKPNNRKLAEKKSSGMPWNTVEPSWDEFDGPRNYSATGGKKPKLQRDNHKTMSGWRKWRM